MDTRFQNLLVDNLMAANRQHNLSPHHKVVGRLYEGTPKDSPIRKLMVDMYVLGAGPKFLRDLVKALILKRALPAAAAAVLGIKEGMPTAYYKPT
jgi:hypothetical protein